ncbi:hypothetical protein [Parabacteroides sp.]|uniref:hypothetical protein n=1 Tax=Parabacteroides sp. TaxID=1869337 RepID=UPI00259B98D0|nr:hypothetical protein [uncultured Parabacteroides sp.]
MNKNCLILGKRFVVLLFVLFLSFCKAEAKDVTLKSGTQIPLELQGTITSKNVSNGSIINFKCTKDIIVNKEVVIRAGEIAKGQVSRVKKNGILGKAGEIEIKVNSIVAVDGTEVYLSSSSLYDDGKDKLLLSLFLCFLIKGGNGEIPAGTQCLASVAGNTVITID